MYRLAASPEEARILRKEAQETVAKYGWNKVSLSKMRCMDSFLREIHRFYGTAGSGTPRRILPVPCASVLIWSWVSFCEQPQWYAKHAKTLYSPMARFFRKDHSCLLWNTL